MPDNASAETARPWNDAKRHVVYTGRMFPQKRDPRRFFGGLALALRADPGLPGRLAIDLYGFRDGWIQNLIDDCGVAACVHMHGLVSHRASLCAQRHADTLLFLDWMDERAEGILTGKLFEYLASGRPILCVGIRMDSEAALIITRSGAGATACSAEEVRDQLLALAHNELTAPQPSVPAGIDTFSRFSQADALLDRIISSMTAREPA